jgi:hypothetical protein
MAIKNMEQWSFLQKINIFLSIHNFLKLIYYKNRISILEVILGRNKS